MIQIPQRYSYIEAYLTLRCNLSCPYCINAYTGVKRKRKELSAREWILGLNNLSPNDKPITLGGGEPTIHPGFYEIANSIDHKIDLLTNGQFDVGEFMKRISPDKFYAGGKEALYYKSIRISFHTHIDKAALVETAYRLQKEGYRVGIFGLNHPHNLFHNVEMTQRCSDAGVYFFVRDFLGFHNDKLYGTYKYPDALNGNRKHCQCRSEDFLIGPCGNIFRCHRDLYDESGEIGNILNIAYSHNDDFMPCNNFGLCNPCDIKLKLNPDLITSKCSVEVKHA